MEPQETFREAGYAGFTVGHAETDADRGWFIGQFLPASAGARRQTAVEVKWGVHAAGETRRGGWCFNQVARTVAVLIEGDFILNLAFRGAVRAVRLHRRGDYVIFEAGVAHNWEAIEQSTVLTIRVPSVPDDQVAVPPPITGAKANFGTD